MSALDLILDGDAVRRIDDLADALGKPSRDVLNDLLARGLPDLEAKVLTRRRAEELCGRFRDAIEWISPEVLAAYAAAREEIGSLAMALELTLREAAEARP